MPSNQVSQVMLSRRQALLLTAGAVAATAIARPATAAAPKRLVTVGPWSALDRMCEQAIADRVLPGLSLAVMRAGELVHSSGFGLANIETGTAVTPLSVFHIGSITKQFTGAAIALLAEEGKLSPDDALARFIPMFPRSGDITLRQMLNHTSGLGNYTEMTPREAFLQAARTDYDNIALLAAMARTNPLFKSEPGTAWAYSNTAYVLLGLVVEIAAQEPYGSYFKRRLFDVAGMGRTAVDDAAEIVPGRASGYDAQPKAPSGFANASFISMTYPQAAGAIRSTTEDLCRWHSALLGGRVLTPASLEQMLKPARLKDGKLPAMPAELAAMQGGTSKDVEYGFGVAMGEFEGRRYVEHNGGINGFMSALRSFQSDKVSVALLTNTIGGPEVGKLLFGIRDAAARIALART